MLKDTFEIKEVYAVCDSAYNVWGIFETNADARHYIKSENEHFFAVVRVGAVRGESPNKVVYLIDNDNPGPYQLDGQENPNSCCNLKDSCWCCPTRADD